MSDTNITIDIVEGSIRSTVLYKPAQTLQGVRWEPLSLTEHFDNSSNLIKATVEELDGGAIVTG